MPRFTLFVGLIFLAACVTMPVYAPQVGKSDEDYQRDYARCRASSAMIPPSDTGGLSGALFSVAMTQQYIDNCMRAQGWIRAN